MEKRSAPGFYLYIVTLFSVVILGYSVWILYSAYSSYQEGKLENFYTGLLLSSVGIVLAMSSLMQMKRRIALASSLPTKVLSVVLCGKCGFKIVRAFGVGDFVHKEAGKCQQCDGVMSVTSIYAEETKKS